MSDHSFRGALFGYTLAGISGAVDVIRVTSLCLFHDIPEARTGDLNYVNKRYVTADEQSAVSDLAETLPFGAEMKGLMAEYREGKTEEARLAHDADQLDLILELKEQKDLGNTYAAKWIEFARQRLHTKIGLEMVEEILKTDSTDWWFKDHDHWWEKNR